MSEDMKIYHIETQKDYNELMIELEKDGYVWFSGNKPTDINAWAGKETVVYLNYCDNYTICYGSISTAREVYPDINIIKHKAKGVKQMEKVGVPQFVVDWYEKHEKGRSIYGIIGLLNDLSKCEDEKMFMWKMNCKGRSDHKLSNAQEVIAKMYLNGYEVEEEKKYLWRKKKEYMFECESEDYTYLNIEKDTGVICFSDKGNFSIHQTILTETQVMQSVGVNDFNKLERVEIDAN